MISVARSLRTKPLSCGRDGRKEGSFARKMIYLTLQHKLEEVKDGNVPEMQRGDGDGAVIGKDLVGRNRSWRFFLAFLAGETGHRLPL
jgi:hypothetical protein